MDCDTLKLERVLIKNGNRRGMEEKEVGQEDDLRVIGSEQNAYSGKLSEVGSICNYPSF